MQKINLKNYQNKTIEFLLKFPNLSVFLCGTLSKFCFSKDFNFPFLFLPMIFCLLYILQNITSYKSSFKIGFIFGLSYFGSSLYWISESFKCVGLGNYGYIAIILLVLYISIYTGFTCLLTNIFSKSRKDMIILFSVFWVILEYIRGFAFTGFPWNIAGYSTYNILYYPQIADIFGIYGVSFIFILTISLFTYRKTIIYGIILLGLTLLYGFYKIEIFDNYIYPKNQDLITIIQPSISQEDKMNTYLLQSNIDRHIDIMQNNQNIYKSKRLIIWPEAAISIPSKFQKEILNYIAKNIDHPDSLIITGIDRIDNNNNLYNSLYIINKKSEILQVYDKRHLLPFGEFIPEFLIDLGFQKLTQGIINFKNGSKSRTIKINNFEEFDVVICYEIAFPSKIIDNKDSKWILNITNDAWFKDTDGPYQHLITTCFRAIEEGKSIARCANNGISSIIDCNGKIIEKLNTNEIGKINHKMPLKYYSTIFSKYGNSIILIILSAIFVITVVFSRKTNNKNKKC